MEVIKMIIIGIMASALVAGMFWSPGMESNRGRVEPLPLKKDDPIADTSLEDKTIHVYLGDLDLEELKQLGRLYEGTPLCPIIKDYRNKVREALEEEAQKAKRAGYIGQLNSKGYGDELLAPLDTGTLEKILKDLE
jgi:hypothetical protein